MASSSWSSSMAADAGLPPFLEGRSRNGVVVVAAAAFPPPQASLFRGSHGGVTSSAGERDFRAMAVVIKYKGTRMREKRLSQLIAQKVLEAKQACAGNETSDECKVAWDEVEEVSKAKANLRRRLAESGRDPLEAFCLENPGTDECSVVEAGDDDDGDDWARI